MLSQLEKQLAKYSSEGRTVMLEFKDAVPDEVLDLLKQFQGVTAVVVQ